MTLRVRRVCLNSAIGDLRKGEPREDRNAEGRGYDIDLPEVVLDPEGLWDRILGSWQNVELS